MCGCGNNIKDYTRRDFLTRTTMGLGAAALSGIMNPLGLNAMNTTAPMGGGGVLGSPHFSPKAKRVIYLFQSGGPSHFELFDYKPMLQKMAKQDLPASIRNGQRLTGMSAGQDVFPIAPSVFDFKQHGQSGAWISELMPHTAKIADDLCFIKSASYRCDQS